MVLGGCFMSPPVSTVEVRGHEDAGPADRAYPLQALHFAGVIHLHTSARHKLLITGVLACQLHDIRHTRQLTSTLECAGLDIGSVTMQLKLGPTSSVCAMRTL